MFSAGSPPSRNSSKTEMDPIESCQQFVAITGASQDEALNWLEMTGYVLQDAVDLFFNSGGANHTTGSSAPALRGQHKHSFDDSYEDDENVRAPDKVKRQKLVNTEAYLGKIVYGAGLVTSYPPYRNHYQSKLKSQKLLKCRRI